MWIFLGFALHSKAEGADVAKKISILVKVCHALRQELAWLEEEEVDGDENDNGNERTASTAALVKSVSAVYDAACVAAMSRMLQTVALCPHVGAFVLGLPRVPPACLGVLKMLMLTGSKGAQLSSSNATGSSRGASAAAEAAAKNRGTRLEALLLMGQIVFSPDEEAGADALHHLLWCSLSEDFELRTKVINLIVK